MDAQSEIMQGREATYEELQAKVEEGIEHFLKKIAEDYGADTQQDGMVVSEYERVRTHCPRSRAQWRSPLFPGEHVEHVQQLAE